MVNYVGKIHKISSWPKFKLHRFYNLRVNFTTGKAEISANPQKVFILTIAQRERSEVTSNFVFSTKNLLTASYSQLISVPSNGYVFQPLKLLASQVCYTNF